MRLPFTPLVVLATLSSVAGAAAPHSLPMVVTRVIDGDTVVALDSNQVEHRLRLAGIDAPEKNQPFSERSRKNLADLTLKQTVMVTWSKVDKYGRLVAVIGPISGSVCQDPLCRAAEDANLLQVRAGLAWHFKRYQDEQSMADRARYSSEEMRARKAQIGLWAEPNPVAPWEWRHGPKDGPVRLSRNGICHDASSANYGSVKRFVEFPNMEACLASGGRTPRARSR